MCHCNRTIYRHRQDWQFSILYYIKPKEKRGKVSNEKETIYLKTYTIKATLE
jgi:hypothetical protein